MDELDVLEIDRGLSIIEFILKIWKCFITKFYFKRETEIDKYVEIL